MKLLEKKIELLIYLMFFVFMIFIIPRPNFGSDMFCWQAWCKYIYQNGISNVYKCGTDYPPLYHYILWFFAKIQGKIEYIEKNINFLKCFTLVFDFLSAFYVLSFIKDKSKHLLYFFLMMFNLAFLYNSIVWGQVDSIFTFFIFLSFLYAYKRNLLLSILFYVVSLNFKAQAIVFFPVLGIFWLPVLVSCISFKRILMGVVVIVALQLLILSPYIIGHDLDKVKAVYATSNDRYPFISLNAYNLWYFFYKGDLRWSPDTITVFSFRLKYVGFILFFTSSFLAFLPVLLGIYNDMKNKKVSFDLRKMIALFALVPLLFFFFNTQMHERYSHPAMLFLALYGFLYRRFWVYFIFSAAYFFNLEAVMHFMDLHKYGLLFFDPRFVAGLFLIVIVILFIDLYSTPTTILNESNL